MTRTQFHADHYGTHEDRITFLKNFRQRHSLTIEDLAKISLYRVDSVKAWFATSESRRRPCPDRALAAILNAKQMSFADYWAFIQQG